ncbi:metal-sensitive transcriptional regulator [Salinispira pacifica]|nr:metal-sensitive transcriptional regulator [Salinispira pacifica]
MARPETDDTVRKAHHPYETKAHMLNRMKRIEGQIRGISRMIQEDVYCDDILHQFMSVESAIQGVKKTLLEAHVKSCVVEQIQNGELEVVDELMTTIRKMTK